MVKDPNFPTLNWDSTDSTGFDSELFPSDSSPAVWDSVFPRFSAAFASHSLWPSRLRSCQETHGWITPGDQAEGRDLSQKTSPWGTWGSFEKNHCDWLTMIWQMWVDVVNFVRTMMLRYLLPNFQLPFCLGYSFFSAGWKGTCQHTKSRHNQFCGPSGTLTSSHIIEYDIRTHDSISFMCFWFPRNPNRHLKYQNEVVFLGSCKTFDCAVLLTIS